MPSLKLAHQIALLMVQNQGESRRSNFFDRLDQELRKHGLRIVANQRGVQGTHISIQSVEERE